MFYYFKSLSLLHHYHLLQTTLIHQDHLLLNIHSHLSSTLSNNPHYDLAHINNLKGYLYLHLPKIHYNSNPNHILFYQKINTIITKIRLSDLQKHTIHQLIHNSLKFYSHTNYSPIIPNLIQRKSQANNRFSPTLQPLTI